jgi:malate dehydrogenase
MKLGIVGGGGLLGATAAFCCAMNSLADEIVLYDVKENVAQSHASDIEQAMIGYNGLVIRVGSMDDLKGSDIILNAAGIPDKPGSRDNFLSGNIGIIREFGERVRTWETKPIVLCATNPVDVLNYKTHEYSGLSREKCIGLSRNDTARFKWAISEVAGLSALAFDALVIGEHGDFQVPLFSTVKSCSTGELISFSAEQREFILRKLKSWLSEYQGLNAGRTSGWTSGVNLSHIIGLIVSGKDNICPCSVIPDGEYGLSGLSIGLPIRLGRDGVREIIELDLAGDEKEGLDRAAAKISGVIKVTD